MERKLSIFNILKSKNAVSFQNGEKVYSLLNGLLQNKEKVILNFKGIEVYATQFFNGAIGQLLKNFTQKDLKRLIEIKNLPEEENVVLQKIIKNSERYYNDRSYQRATIHAMNELVSHL